MSKARRQCRPGPALAAAFLVAVAPAQAAGDVAKILQGCVPCHGADGIARDAEVPILAGQNDLYLLNQMKAFRSGKRRHHEMAYMMHDLDDETLLALADYFSSLPPRP